MRGEREIIHVIYERRDKKRERKIDREERDIFASESEECEDR